MTKTVDQLLLDYKDGMAKRVKDFKDLANSMLYDNQDKDYQKVQPGTSYYNGHPDVYPNGAEMTYCNVFVYLFMIRLLKLGKKLLSMLLGIDPRVNQPSPFYTSINLFEKNLKGLMVLNGSVLEVPWWQAQNIARFGGIVFVISPEVPNKDPRKTDWGHIALVWPQDEMEAEEKNMLVVGAGSRAVFGVKTMKKTFFDYHYRPKYYHIVEEVKETEGED